MRALIQRVSEGKVSIAGEVSGQIKAGFVILLGVKTDDLSRDVDYLVDKIVGLRIFTDKEGRFNDSLTDVQGSVLIVSQFTLFADTRKGRRPGFTDSARPEIAVPLYEEFIDKFKKAGVHVESGRFGADMQVSLINDGPVTIMLDSEDKYPRN